MKFRAQYFIFIFGMVAGLGCNQIPEPYQGEYLSLDGKIQARIKSTSAQIQIGDSIYRFSDIFNGDFSEIYEALREGRSGIYVTPALIYQRDGLYYQSPFIIRSNIGPASGFTQSPKLMDVFFVHPVGDADASQPGAIIRKADFFCLMADITVKAPASDISLQFADHNFGTLYTVDKEQSQVWSIGAPERAIQTLHLSRN